ncbi:MAG: hypothetical protein H7A13_08980 [Pseudomonadales bacterium]|nr:hypothetical protein [Pseudomonadales bacterium]
MQRADSLVRLIDVDDGVARRLLESAQQQRFSQLLAGSGARGYAVGPGDVLEVSIWEAPPARGAAEVPQYSDFVVVLGEQSGESGKLILC